jgi:hypothetical protein
MGGTLPTRRACSRQAGPTRHALVNSGSSLAASAVHTAVCCISSCLKRAAAPARARQIVCRCVGVFAVYVCVGGGGVPCACACSSQLMQACALCPHKTPTSVHQRLQHVLGRHVKGQQDGHHLRWGTGRITHAWTWDGAAGQPAHRQARLQLLRATEGCQRHRGSHRQPHLLRVLWPVAVAAAGAGWRRQHEALDARQGGQRRPVHGGAAWRRQVQLEKLQACACQRVWWKCVGLGPAHGADVPGRAGTPRRRQQP